MAAGAGAHGKWYASPIQQPHAKAVFALVSTASAMYAAAGMGHALKVAKKVKLRKNIWFLNVNASKVVYMRAFIFSLDAFVAFTLALVAIYSLIFFSSIPSSYYYLLTQGHFLAKDVLFSSATSDCIDGTFVCDVEGGTILDNIVFGDDSSTSSSIRDILINDSIGSVVPVQYGYVLEVSSDNGDTWSQLYHTDAEGDPHADSKKKLSVSSQIPVFEYEDSPQKEINPYIYTSCQGDGTDYLITCDDVSTAVSSDVSSSQIVPKTGVKLVRLTIFI